MMIEKYAVYPGVVSGRPTVIPFTDGRSLTKLAGYEFLPEVEEFASALRPVEDVVYVLVNAMGAGEYWGANLNGDFFPEAALCHKGMDYGYLTFYRAHVYKHHVNKDPSKSYGDVLLAVWNPLMKRVELVVSVHKDRAMLHGGMDVYDRLAAGDYLSVSMGCRVKYDLCSICLDRDKYNRAKASFDPLRHRTVEDAVLEWHSKDPIRGLARTRAEYCVHAKTMLGKVFPDGRKVYVINDFPRFFDISFVFIGADKTARVMAKIASFSEGSKEKSASVSTLSRSDNVDGLLVKEASIDKEAVLNMSIGSDSISKLADLVKRVASDYTRTVVPTLEKSVPRLSPKILELIGDGGLPWAVARSIHARFILTPADFQWIALRHMGRGALANRLLAQGQTFAPCELIGPGWDLPEDAGTQKSIFSALFGRRFDPIPLEAQERILSPVNAGLGFGRLRGGVFEAIASLYNRYRDLLMRHIVEQNLPIRSALFGSSFFGPTTPIQKRTVIVLIKRI